MRWVSVRELPHPFLYLNAEESLCMFKEGKPCKNPSNGIFRFFVADADCGIYCIPVSVYHGYLSVIYGIFYHGKGCDVGGHISNYKKIFLDQNFINALVFTAEIFTICPL